jgi:hypothetical protein
MDSEKRRELRNRLDSYNPYGIYGVKDRALFDQTEIKR